MWGGCGTLSFRCTNRFLPLVVDLVQSSECVDNNNTSPGVFFRVYFFFVLFCFADDPVFQQRCPRFKQIYGGFSVPI